MDFGRKRGYPDGPFVANGGIKRSKQERESFATGIGSKKSKPCTKFFSTSGCPFGGECHFLHYLPGGYNAMTQMTNMGGNPYSASVRNPMVPSPFTEGSAPTVKTKLCNKFNTAEGCKFGNKCHFAHGEMELGRTNFLSHGDPIGPTGNWLSSRADPPHRGLAATANFGASATAKISVDASLAGAIIGKGGVNSKQVCRISGVKLVIKEHDTDPNQRNIELEGTFDQIKHASAMVGELIANIGTTGHHPPPAMPSPAVAPANNFKTKACKHFAIGSCTFGESCRFAHGDGELQPSV